MPFLVSRAAAAVLAVFFPPLCLLCDAPLARGERPEVCGACRSSFRRPPGPGCPRCGAGLGACLEPAASDCRTCRGWRALAGARAAFLFAGPVRAWVHRLKYGGVTGLAALAAEPLATVLAEAPPEWRRAAALVPIPLHAARRRERGFNQSELLAAEAASAAGLPWLPVLRRRRPTAAQVGLGAAGRRGNVAGAFEVRAEHRAFCWGRCLILVDDVLTTGATLDAAAVALEEEGAGPVFGLAAARALPGLDA